MIAIIVATAKGGVIGCKGRMPWHLSEDLKYFRRTTMGASVVMGRKTFESFEGLLPGRANIIITRNADYKAEGAIVVGSLEEALVKAREQGDDKNIFIIGGGEIYRQAMDLVDRLYITEIDMEVEGDTTFPEMSPEKWVESSRESHAGYAFVVYDKIN